MCRIPQTSATRKPTGGIRDTQQSQAYYRLGGVPQGSADSTLDPGLPNAMPIYPKSATANAKKTLEKKRPEVLG